MNKYNNYWHTLQSISEWTRFSDTKAGIIIAVFGVILTIIYTNAESVYHTVSCSLLLLIIGIIAFLLSLISLIFCFLSINPRLSNKNPTSVLYYGHIAQLKSWEDYYNLASEKMEDDTKFEKQLTEQIFTNAKIAWNKFCDVTWAIRFFFGSLFFLFIEIFVYLFI